ncbi:MAG: hypothetical protein J7L15_04295 [Clostridiales bacterium]|nr:hypothetical protein [Clostridiales bacterium]
MSELKVKKLDEKAVLPTRKYPTDAGLDVYSLEKVMISPRSHEIVRTGVTIDFIDNTVVFVWPKSRSNFLIGAGVIDNTYQGEIFVKVFNTSPDILVINKGQAVAQIVITPVLCPEVVEVSEIHQEASLRGGTGGIGGNLD